MSYLLKQKSHELPKKKSDHEKIDIADSVGIFQHFISIIAGADHDSINYPPRINSNINGTRVCRTTKFCLTFLS